MHRATRGWLALFVLGALGAVVVSSRAVSALTSSRGQPMTVGLVVLVVSACALLAACVAAFVWARKARIEIFHEGIRVWSPGSTEATWGQITAFWRLAYRDARNIAHDAGWALDTQDGRRLRISPTYGAFEPVLATHLERHGIRAAKADTDSLPPIARRD